MRTFIGYHEGSLVSSLILTGTCVCMRTFIGHHESSIVSYFILTGRFVSAGYSNGIEVILTYTI